MVGALASGQCGRYIASFPKSRIAKRFGGRPRSREVCSAGDGRDSIQSTSNVDTKEPDLPFDQDKELDLLADSSLEIVEQHTETNTTTTKTQNKHKDSGHVECHSAEKGGNVSSKVEGGKLFRLSLPMVAQNLAQYALWFIVVVYVGRLGAMDLSIVSLGTSVFTLSGLSIIIGVVSGIETLCGQAYGAGKYKLVGTILQRALLISMGMALIISACWTQAGWFLLKIGQSRELALKAASYLQLMIPVLLLDTLVSCISRYQTAQGMVQPVFVASWTSVLFAPFFCWLFISRCGFGVYGAPMALAASYAILLAILLHWNSLCGVQMQGSPRQTWHGWSKLALKGWGEYFKVAIPVVGIVCSEWWMYEVMVLMSGWLKNSEIAVAVMGATNSLANLVYMLPLGISMAACTRISTELGSGRPSHAQTAARIASLSCLVLMAGITVSESVFRQNVARVLTSDPQVINALKSVTPTVAVAELFSGMSQLLFGILRGCNQSKLGLISYIFTYWAVGIPLGVLLGLVWGWGVRGFWCALAFSGGIQCMWLAKVVSGLDYKQEAKRATLLVGQGLSSA